METTEFDITSQSKFVPSVDVVTRVSPSTNVAVAPSSIVIVSPFTINEVVPGSVFSINTNPAPVFTCVVDTGAPSKYFKYNVVGSSPSTS